MEYAAYKFRFWEGSLHKCLASSLKGQSDPTKKTQTIEISKKQNENHGGTPIEISKQSKFQKKK